MPRRSRRTPKYCCHKRSGHAYVRVNGQQRFLGKYGTAESLEKYRRIVAELRSEDGPTLGDEQIVGDITVIELIHLYYQHARRYYVKNGKPTGTAELLRPALGLLKDLYGRTPAVEFGPKRLKAVRQAMIDAGQSRSYINDNIGRLKRMFRWATSEELLPAAVYHSLRSVPRLRCGHSEARETPPVEPVDDETVTRTLEFLPPVVGDMVRFQRLTGCRPVEVRLIRPSEVDRSVEPWQYRPDSHKTQHFGKERVILIGPRAQEILRPYLLRDGEAYCFTHNWGRNRVPARPEGHCYTEPGYAAAITRACGKAGVSHWSPNRLRHAAATLIRREYGLEAAQVVLGHSQANVTEIYAERDMALAAKVVGEVG